MDEQTGNRLVKKYFSVLTTAPAAQLEDASLMRVSAAARLIRAIDRIVFGAHHQQEDAVVPGLPKQLKDPWAGRQAYWFGHGKMHGLLMTRSSLDIVPYKRQPKQFRA